jgi:hypothetical protein
MSRVRRGLSEFWQMRTMKARVWWVGLLWSAHVVIWVFWSESFADRLAYAWFVLFAFMWAAEGKRGSPSNEALRSPPADS